MPATTCSCRPFLPAPASTTWSPGSSWRSAGRPRPEYQSGASARQRRPAAGRPHFIRPRREPHGTRACGQAQCEDLPPAMMLQQSGSASMSHRGAGAPAGPCHQALPHDPPDAPRYPGDPIADEFEYSEPAPSRTRCRRTPCTSSSALSRPTCWPRLPPAAVRPGRPRPYASSQVQSAVSCPSASAGLSSAAASSSLS